ncbi:hypothetical protein BJY27_008351 [Streptomyces rapamycinicus]|uniref:Tyr recombinase domain-containing protein n=2 Tax=Streptomyces rapamycinicus TaxID=1226757 RepID=A0A3L8QXI5_STRRN|nr:hypothetical protein [Streptomyces rapamycinicus]RLV71652.1 hypothetical protein D3C57_144035 [Streptomyces rapamycinicus NRRL 5491]
MPSKPGFALSSTVARGPSLAPGTRHGPTWVRPSRCCWSGPAATTTCERSPGRASSRSGTLSPANSAKAGSSPCGHCSGTRRRTTRSSATPTIAIRVARQTGGVLQALAQADIDEATATATTPDIRLIVALAAIYAARPKTIRTMKLEDVDLGNRRITGGGHLRPLDDLTRRAVLDWLDHRRNRWPNTANPHLLTTQKTASNSARPANSGPPGQPATSPPPWNGSASTDSSKRPSPTAPTHSTSRSSSESMRRPPSATRTPPVSFSSRSRSRGIAEVSPKGAISVRPCRPTRDGTPSCPLWTASGVVGRLSGPLEPAA